MFKYLLSPLAISRNTISKFGRKTFALTVWQIYSRHYTAPNLAYFFSVTQCITCISSYGTTMKLLLGRRLCCISSLPCNSNPIPKCVWKRAVNFPVSSVRKRVSWHQNGYKLWQKLPAKKYETVNCIVIIIHRTKRFAGPVTVLWCMVKIAIGCGTVVSRRYFGVYFFSSVAGISAVGCLATCGKYRLHSQGVQWVQVHPRARTEKHLG